jgi:alkanesulfonate monooxygenase SsuD/methylene tetrahydromethanopterin reductase-like flavin-dependent oxidoreductase (luciferase family)
LGARLAGIMAEPHVGELMAEWGGLDLGDLDALRAADAAGDGEAGARLISDEVAEACVLVGDAARIRERIDEYVEAGVEHALLLPRLPDFERVADALAP